MEATANIDTGQERLLALGYRQTLKRSITWHHGMAIAMQTVNPLVTIGTLYGAALSYGGPAFVFWGWMCGGLLTMLVALTMSELISAFPVSGAMYWWTSTLALQRRIPRLAPYFSFLACRTSLIGQGLLVAFLEELCVNSIATTVFLITSKPQQAGYKLGPAMMMYLYCMLVTCHVSLHCLPLRTIAQSAFWVNMVTLLACFVIILVLLMPSTATTKIRGPGYALFHYEDVSGYHFSVSYSFALALTLPIYGFTGYDACAHLAEETHAANATMPYATVFCVATVALLGALLIAGLNANIQSLEYLFDPNNATGGKSPFLQIWHDRASDTRYGRASDILISLMLCAITFFGGLYAMTAASRLVWAFARDDLVPGARHLRQLDEVAQCPIIATCYLAVFCVIVYVLCLLTDQGYDILAGMQTGGIYFSYLMPIALRASLSHDAWEPGVFSLGRWSRPVAIAAATWLLVQLAIAMLPSEYPVTAQTMNWTGPCLGCFLLFVSALWVASLRLHFSGRQTDLTNSDLLKMWYFMDPPLPLREPDRSLQSSRHVLNSKSTGIARLKGLS